MTFLNLPDQILIRCPVCGRSDMAPVGITYVFPGRCEMMLACPDEGCDGAVYTTMGDPSLVATFSDGLYGLIRVDSPEGPFLRLEGGEARSVHDLRPIGETEKLHMPGGVAAPAQGLAHLPHLQGETGVQPVEDAGLPHTGISCKGG